MSTVNRELQAQLTEFFMSHPDKGYNYTVLKAHVPEIKEVALEVVYATLRSVPGIIQSDTTEALNNVKWSLPGHESYY